ncbi:MAG: hypothetical protein ABI960_02635 [Candidatus Eisenbacteria bacterium]
MTGTLHHDRRIAFGIVFAGLGTVAAGAAPASAGAGAFALDAQRYSVDGGRTVKSATAVGVMAGPGFDASLALSRIDDSFDGAGYAAGLGGSVGLASALSLRGGVTRVLRSTAPDAWSLRLGPEIHLGRSTLGANLFRTRRDDAVVTQGFAADLEQAMSARFTTHVGGSFAHTQGEADARAGEFGARWKAVGPLHLLGAVGLASDPDGVLTGSPGGGTGGGPIGGLGPGLGLGRDPSGPGAGGSAAARVTARLGVRILLP